MTIEARRRARGMDNDSHAGYGASSTAPTPPTSKQLYAQYAADPTSVPESWQRLLRGVATTRAADATQAAKGPEWNEPRKHQNGELVSRARRQLGRDSKPERQQEAPQVGPAPRAAPISAQQVAGSRSAR